VKLPDGSPFVITETSIQFGTNTDSDKHLIRLWTHGDIVVNNDLADLSMDELNSQLRGRSTQNITARALPLQDFIKHEMSPSAKLKHMTHGTMAEMYVNLKKSLEDPLGNTSKGTPYIGRTEVVVACQTPSHFMNKGCISDLLLNTDVVLILLSPFETPMWIDTERCVRLHASQEMKVFSPRFVAGKVSLKALLAGLVKYAGQSFESCEAPRECLHTVATSDVPLPCYTVDDRTKAVKYIGDTNAPLKVLAESAGRFVPYKTFIFGIAEPSYFYLEDMAQVEGSFELGVDSDVTLHHFFGQYPYLQHTFARVLQWHVRKALPSNESLHLLVPLQVLSRHVTLLKACGTYEKAEGLLCAAVEVLKQMPEPLLPSTEFMDFEAEFVKVRKCFTDASSVFTNRTTADVMARYKPDGVLPDAISHGLSLYVSPMTQYIDGTFGSLSTDGIPLPAGLGRNVSSSPSYKGIATPSR